MGDCVPLHAALMCLALASSLTVALTASTHAHERTHSTLDHVDVSNRAMMEAMDQLLRIDYDMCQTYGDRVPQSMVRMAVPTSPPTAKATVC